MAGVYGDRAPSLQQMALLADAIRFGKPSGDFVIDLVDAHESERMKVIPRRKCFDAAKARILEAARENNMTVHPILPNNECRETHPDLKRNSRFLREHCDRSVLPGDGQHFVENRANGFRFPCKM